MDPTTTTVMDVSMATAMAAHRPSAPKTPDNLAATTTAIAPHSEISMAAHRPFAPKISKPDNLTTTTKATSPLSETPTAAQTPPQPQRNDTEPVTETPAKKASKKKAQPKQALILLKDNELRLPDAILNKIKTCEPFRPLDMPLLTLDSTHGNVKVLLHCQTTRLYLSKNGQYMGDLPWFFPAAGMQLREALEERGQQRGKATEENPEGCTFSSVMKPDEVLVGEE